MPLQPPPFSPIVLLTLLAVVAASSVTFWLLVRRATSHRQWVALSDWARDRGFRFNRAGLGAAPAPFHLLQNISLTTRLSLSKGHITLSQLDADRGKRDHSRWNVMIRDVSAEWPPTGLRPANATTSVLDLFSLSSFPTFGGSERFVAFGTDSAAARLLSKSMIRSLLPPDIGLLLIGQQLILDFSDRPFDAIEFGRMLALADQLAAHAPAPSR